MHKLQKEIDLAIARLSEQFKDGTGNIRHLALSLTAHVLSQSVECYVLDRRDTDWFTTVNHIDNGKCLWDIFTNFLAKRTKEIFVDHIFREKQDDRQIFNDVMIGYASDVSYREIKKKLPKELYGRIICP